MPESRLRKALEAAEQQLLTQGGRREPVTTTDVANAIRMMARFPWNEVRHTHRALEESIREGARERKELIGALRESAAEGRHSPDLVERADEIVRALEATAEQQAHTAAALAACATSLAQCVTSLERIVRNTSSIRQSIEFWGLIVSGILLYGLLTGST